MIWIDIKDKLPAPPQLRCVNCFKNEVKNEEEN